MRYPYKSSWIQRLPILITVLVALLLIVSSVALAAQSDLSKVVFYVS